ncbi:hypothetical protein CHS0354_029857 [Potamilus streckersoni]|uniref:Uncharacterized protein n=1 Tax=Potamilus streckersoni TaxID=2493646 RepID=A0AAE0THM8_9BIVA|nr:hypothetical protein CHS0354_029857 [Potamilus streckersoni]
MQVRRRSDICRLDSYLALYREISANDTSTTTTISTIPNSMPTTTTESTQQEVSQRGWRKEMNNKGCSKEGTRESRGDQNETTRKKQPLKAATVISATTTGATTTPVVNMRTQPKKYYQNNHIRKRGRNNSRSITGQNGTTL